MQEGEKLVCIKNIRTLYSILPKLEINKVYTYHKTITYGFTKPANYYEVKEYPKREFKSGCFIKLSELRIDKIKKLKCLIKN